MTTSNKFTALQNNNYKIISIDPDNLSIFSSTQRWNEDIRSTPSFVHWHELFDSRSIDVKNVLADRTIFKTSLDKMDRLNILPTFDLLMGSSRFTNMLVPPQWIHFVCTQLSRASLFTVRDFFESREISFMPAPFMDTAGEKDTPAIFLFHRDAYQCELQWNGKIYPKLVEHEGEKNAGLFISNAFSKP